MLQIKNLTSENSILADIGLTLSGHTVILGPSGAGKTTLFRCLAGLQKYTGDIYFDGMSLAGLYGPARNISIAWQDGRLLPNLTVLKNIEIGGRSEYISELADMFQIGHLLHRYPHELSGGECQRANILRALCSPAKCVLLDEPMQGMDPVLVRNVLQRTLHWLTEMNRVAFMVTHDVDQVYGLFNDAVFVKDGRIVASDNFRHLYENPVSPWLADFFGSYTILDSEDLQNFDLHISESPCLVRPEWFKIKKPPFKKDIKCNATVTEKYWDGPRTKVKLELNETRKPVIVEVYSEIDINIGEKVYVNFKKCSRPDWVLRSSNVDGDSSKGSNCTN